MKKKLVALLCALILVVACCTVTGEEIQNDFLLIDGLSWSTPLEEYSDIFKEKIVVDEEGACTISSFSVPPIKGHANAEFLFLDGMDQPCMATMLIKVDRPLIPLMKDTSMQDAYHILVEEGDRQYSSRSEVLFSSAEEMAAVLESEEKTSIVISSFLGGLKGLVKVFQNLYNTDRLDCITDAKAWYLKDNNCVVGVLYSGKKRNDNEIAVVYVNGALFDSFGSFASQMGMANSNVISSSRFGLPTGFRWEDEKEVLISALGRAYDGEAYDVVSAVFADDPLTGGYYAFGEYQFVNDQLMTICYTIPEADDLTYENIMSILAEDLGTNRSDEYGSIINNIKQGNPAIEKGELWVTTDAMSVCCYAPSEEMVIVMSVPWSIMMSMR